LVIVGAKAGVRRRLSPKNPRRTRALMRALSLSLLYVVSMSVFIAAYSLLPLA
jgi:hypothetical protein